jgi:hypothetical protein
LLRILLLLLLLLLPGKSTGRDFVLLLGCLKQIQVEGVFSAGYRLHISANIALLCTL